MALKESISSVIGPAVRCVERVKRSVLEQQLAARFYNDMFYEWYARHRHDPCPSASDIMIDLQSKVQDKKLDLGRVVRNYVILACGNSDITRPITPEEAAKGFELVLHLNTDGENIYTTTFEEGLETHRVSLVISALVNPGQEI